MSDDECVAELQELLGRDETSDIILFAAERQAVERAIEVFKNGMDLTDRLRS